MTVIRCNGVLGPRAAWLEEVVRKGYLEHGKGYLLRDLWDPAEKRTHRAAEDRRRALFENPPRPKRRFGT